MTTCTTSSTWLAREISADNQAAEPGQQIFEWFTDDQDVHIYERYQDSAAALAHVQRFVENFASRFLSLCTPTRMSWRKRCNLPATLPALVQEYREEVRLRPDDPDAHAHLANAYQSAGDLDKAFAEYQVALQIQPQSPEFHVRIALGPRGDGEPAGGAIPA